MAVCLNCLPDCQPIIDLPSNISDNNHAFTSRRYLFPVPQSERDVNPSLDQNPEW